MLISSVAASKWDFILSVTVKGNEDWGQKVMAMLGKLKPMRRHIVAWIFHTSICQEDKKYII